jgi:hypothetical protein
VLIVVYILRPAWAIRGVRPCLKKKKRKEKKKEELFSVYSTHSLFCKDAAKFLLWVCVCE